MFQKQQEVIKGTRVVDPFNAIVNHIIKICNRDIKKGIIKPDEIEQFVGQWRVLRFQIADYSEAIKNKELTLDSYKNVVKQLATFWETQKAELDATPAWLDFIFYDEHFGVFSLLQADKINAQVQPNVADLYREEI